MCCRSIKYLYVQKTAATAKPIAPNQPTALNHTCGPLLAGMLIADMSMPGIDISGGVLDRAGIR